MSLSPDQKLAAYFLGRRIAGQRRKQDRVPVAYLYNGVRLPGLPEEWNPETHPYVVIFYSQDDAGVKNYYIHPTSYKKNAVSSGTVVVVSSDIYKLVDGVWMYYESETTGGKAIWANYDIYYNDEVENVGGTIYLAASDPVPVYE